MQDEELVIIKYEEPVGELVAVEMVVKTEKGEKKAVFPNVITELKGGHDIDPLLYHYNTISPNSPLIISLPYILDIKRRATFLENLPLRTRPKTSFDTICKNHIIIADPCPEAFWLKRPELRKKLKEIPEVPSEFCDVFNEYESKNYGGWTDAAARGDFANFADALIRFEKNFGFDFFVSPTPVIDGMSPSSPLFVNSFNAAIAKIMKDSNKKLPLLYNLTLNSNVFYKHKNDLIENIKSYVTEEFNKKLFWGLYIRIRGIDNLPARKDYKKSESLLHDFISWLGSLSKSFELPVFLIRSGYFGYYSLEKGIQAFSEPTTGDLSDIKEIKIGESHPKKENLYGKTLIIDDCVELTKKELDEYLERNERLPEVPGVSNIPNEEQLKNPTRFRDHFSKPRRFATRTEEIRRLKESLKKKEIDPIEQYISRCENKILKNFLGIKNDGK